VTEQSPPTSTRFFCGIGGFAFLRTGVPLSVAPNLKVIQDFAAEAAAIASLLNSAPPIREVTQRPGNTNAASIEIRSGQVIGIAPQFINGLFGFRLSIPAKNQNLPAQYSGIVIEEVDVTYDGVSYCFIAPRPDSPWGASDLAGYMRYDWHLYNVVDEFVHEILRRDPNHPIVRMTPSLLGFGIDINIEPTIGNDSLVINAESSPNGLSVLVKTPLVAFDPRYLARIIAYSILNAVTQFFDAEQRLHLRDTTINEMQALLQQVSSCYRAISAMNPWHFWRITRFGFVRQMRNCIGQVLEKHSELSAIKLQNTRDVIDVKAHITDNDVMSPSLAFFVDHLSEPPPRDVEALLESLRFFAEESRSFASVDVVVLSTLMAASISAAISILIGILIA
jgi:hypothetical protein